MKPGSADAVGAYVVGTVSGQTVCTDVISAIGSLAVCTNVVGTVSGQAVCTDVVSAIGGLTVGAYVVGTVSSQAVCTDVVRTVGSLTIRASVRSISVGRTTFGNHITVQCRMGIRNRQSESARRQDGQTKTKKDI